MFKIQGFFFGEPLGSNVNTSWAIFGMQNWRRRRLSSAQRIVPTSTWRAGLPPLLTKALEGALVQWKCDRKDAKLSPAEAKEGASAGELDVKAPSAFDAENSDPASNSDALTMTALAFDAECSDLDANLNEPMRPIDALEKGAAQNSFLQSGVDSVLRKMPLDSKRATRLRDEIG